MARGRMIANTVATDKRLNALTCAAALVYLMAIPHLDRDGLILGDTMPFWGKVCPRRVEFMGHMADIIAEWIDAGLVISYECDEGTILCFTGFFKNQTGMHYDREAASSFPPPPGYIRAAKGLEKLSLEVGPDKVRSESGVGQDDVPLKFKVKESNSNSDGDGWRAVVDTYQQEIGVITPSVSEEIKAYFAEMGPVLIVDAIKEASRNNVRKWSYVDSVLHNWRANGKQQRSKDDSGSAWSHLGGNLPDYMEQ